MADKEKLDFTVAEGGWQTDLAAAEKALDQIIAFATGERVTIRGLSPLVRKRICAMTGEPSIDAHQVAELITRISQEAPEEQSRIFHYLAGFPDEAAHAIDEKTDQQPHTSLEEQRGKIPRKIGRALLSHTLVVATGEDTRQQIALLDGDSVIGEDAHEDELVEGEEIETEGMLGSVRLSSDPIRDYLLSINKTPLLTTEEEVDLARRIEVGVTASQILGGNKDLRSVRATHEELNELVEQGQAAKDRFIRANLRLVVSIAKKYTGKGVDFLELIQEGNAGLIHAVELFDYTKSFKFSTYATWWIKQSIARSNMNYSRTIRVPIHALEDFQKIKKLRAEYVAQFGHEPSDRELLATGVSRKQIESYHTIRSQDPISLSAKIGDDGTELGDLIGANPDQEDTDADAIKNIALEQLAQALETLSDIEQDVLRRRFGFATDEPQKLREVGEALGVTGERVRQIESKALRKLRHPSRAHTIRGLLDD